MLAGAMSSDGESDELLDEKFWEAMEKEVTQLIENGAKFQAPPEDGSTELALHPLTYSASWQKLSRKTG